MTSPNAPLVVIGLQGAQMPANAIRGIGRWAHLYTLWLIERFPERIAAVSIDEKLPIPAVVNTLPLDLPVLVSEESPPRTAGRLVFHAMSVFEDLELGRLWPSWARDPAVGLTVTVHDMIPALYPSDYFQGAMRYMLESRHQMVAHAGSVVTNSEATAREVRRLLGLQQDDTYPAPILVAKLFSPHPAGRAGAYSMLAAERGIQPDFILSIGNVDPRKNLTGLIRSYACLPAALRAKHQLVLTCSQASPEGLAPLQALADDLGVGDRVVLTSFVDDPTMLSLYQACHVMVFPSLYEGLGIPVAEAMSCGAATIVSDIAPMRELVSNPEARFDPNDVARMGDALQRILQDRDFAELRRTQAISDARRLARQAGSPSVLRAYDRAAARCA